MSGSTLTMSPSQLQPLSIDLREMDAARALLGVSPFTIPSSDTIRSPTLKANPPFEEAPVQDSSRPMQTHGFVVEHSSQTDVSNDLREEEATQPLQRRPRSGSEGLDYLAALAGRERHAPTMEPIAPMSFASFNSGPSLSSDDDSEAMPPPPRRPRCVSNPEGMDLWNNESSSNSAARRFFVLPASILEEELAEARVAVRDYCSRTGSPPSIPEHAEYLDQDNENLTPDELLRLARLRLLEDLSESNALNGDKGESILPHALSKYKDIYNKNGRIGIYTPQERSAIINRFIEKRAHRNWNKKIRYNCRKSLADRRLRIKGRFVKRSEQEQLKKELEESSEEQHEPMPEDDHNMPDINDPEAGFCPTEDMPYRRLRRHTVT